MSVTIKDVAKAAGVSVATVSRVLNNTAAVSSATTELVNTAIKELGYSPNFLGRNLRKCETNMILAVIPSTEHTFYSDIIRGLQDAAAPSYDVLIATTNGNVNLEMRLLNMIYNKTVDGAVFLGTRLDADTLNHLKNKYNIALCCERVEGTDIFTLTVDDKKAGFDAVEALIEAGHKRIGLISADKLAPSSIDREKGYRLALEKHGIPVDEALIFHGSYEYSDGTKGFNRLMDLPDPPSAVFCISDLLAIASVKAAEERGLTAGKDIDIMGFDNSMMARIYTPGITTIAQPGYDMGYRVMKCLLDNMQNSAEHSGHMIMKHTLIKRESALCGK